MCTFELIEPNTSIEHSNRPRPLGEISVVRIIQCGADEVADLDIESRMVYGRRKNEKKKKKWKLWP